MNRRNRFLIVVGSALAVASLASWGVYQAIQRMPVREVQIVERQMVVARQPVPVGVSLTVDHVRLTPWPAESPVPGGFEKIEDVVGRGTVGAFVPNEPIIETKLAAIEAGVGLPPQIPEGMRAMSVRVNDIVGVAGFVTPGTRVDVLVTVRPNNSDDIARIVLSNVQVLAAGTRYDAEQAKADGQPVPTTVVTVLVTPPEAEKLALAQMAGQLMLALRNPLDTLPVETQGVRMANLVAAPNPAPVQTSVQGRPRVVTPPPPPAPKPYVVETIRGAERTQLELKGKGKGQ